MLSPFLRHYALLVLLSLQLFAVASPAPRPMNVIDQKAGGNGAEQLVIQGSDCPCPSSPPPPLPLNGQKFYQGSYKINIESPQNTTKIDCVKDNRLEVKYIVDELFNETVTLDIVMLFNDTSFELAKAAPVQPGEHSAFLTFPTSITVPNELIVIRFLEKVTSGVELTTFHNDIKIAYKACPSSPPKKPCSPKTKTVVSTTTKTATIIATVTATPPTPKTTPLSDCCVEGEIRTGNNSCGC